MRAPFLCLFVGLLAGCGGDAGLAPFHPTLVPSSPPPPPSLTAVLPPEGPLGGGIRITVLGDHFHLGTSVAIDGTPARDPIVVSRSRIEATLPPGRALGPKPVTVTNPDGQSADASLLSYRPSPLFLPPRRFPAGEQPSAMAVGDVNGDGHLDVALAHAMFETVTLLLGNGDGTLQPPVDRPAVYSGFIEISDINGDGRADLLLTNCPKDAISVLLGHGDGTFESERRLPAGDCPVGIAVGDVDADLRPDIVSVNYPTVSVLSGNGDGTFRAPKHTPWSGGGYPTIAAFDPDGHADVVFDDHLSYNWNTVSILSGKGDGAFQPVVSYLAGMHVLAVKIGDFDTDGFVDLAVANLGGVSLLRSQGDGTFTPAVQHRIVGGGGPLAVADLDYDGKLDLAVINGFGTISVRLGNGNGTFQEQADFPAGPDAAHLAVGRFNSDGWLDLVVASKSKIGEVNLLLNRGL